MVMSEQIEILKEKIHILEELLKSLNKVSTYSEKLNILNQLPIVEDYLKEHTPVHLLIKVLNPEAEFAIKSIIAIGQAPIVFNVKTDEIYFKNFIVLLEQLLDLEVFYRCLGGIIGYHCTMLSLIVQHIQPDPISFENIRYIHPEGIQLEENNSTVNQTIRWGIENIQHVAAIYPVGGAGDRLNLKDETTQEPLPAALLPFLGRSLLDGLIRDLQAQEYLAYKVLGHQPTTPIAIMTSIEKNNHIHILNICKQANWYGRDSKNFHFFIQPLVPLLTIDGNWSLSAPLTLCLKPCGHGVLWKLAEESGVFDWLESHGRQECFVRQINNPIGATDQGLLSLIGVGCVQKKAFGFLSCERLLNSDEGTNVLIEKKVGKNYEYCLTNIEYTEFTQRGLGEVPAQPESKYSMYPTNTNILFANIPTIRRILKICSLPGQLVNMKSKVPFIDIEGNLSQVHGGRLESTMQNIADSIVDSFPRQLKGDEYETALQSFILYNPRSKTISTTKRSYHREESPIGTPEQAYYDLLSNNWNLLMHCQFDLPSWKTMENFLENGPDVLFLFHPALGPLYSIIQQKIRGGRLFPGAEIQLNIAEIDVENLTLDGSLLIETKSCMGIEDSNGILQYGNESRCSLKNVTIVNQGINRSIEQNYWKNEISRKEVVKIILHENSEFHAENITLEGSHTFDVPPNSRLILSGSIEKLKTELIHIQNPTWEWHYSFDKENKIRLKKR